MPVVRAVISALVVAIALCPHALSAASVDELLKSVIEPIPAHELEAPGSPKRAEAIAELLKEDLGLSAGDVAELGLALAEAWVDAGRSDAAEAVLRGLFTGKAASVAQRERAGLCWVASWQQRVRGAEKPAELPDPVVTMTAFGAPTGKVLARAHSAAGLRALALKQTDEAVKRFDGALAAMVGAPTLERVPLYTLRLLAMEAAGTKAEEVQAWLQERAADPAIAQILASALTNGQKLVGQSSPPLSGKRVDGQAGVVDLATYKGKPALLYFFATWHQPCEALTRALATFAAQTPALGVVGISLDTKDSQAGLAAYLKRTGVAFPVIGDGQGWDSEVDDAFHVEGIPQLVLIAADGRVAAVELVGKSPDETVKNLTLAMAELAGGARIPGAKPAPDAKPAAPVEVIP